MRRAVRAGGVERAVRVGLALVGVVLSECVRACNAEARIRERGEERCRRPSESEAKREVVHALAASVKASVRGRHSRLGLLESPEDQLPVIVRSLEGAGEVVPTLEVEANGRRVERRPIMELHASAEEKGPAAAVLA